MSTTEKAVSMEGKAQELRDKTWLFGATKRKAK